jgi:hypothetical protein
MTAEAYRIAGSHAIAARGCWEAGKKSSAGAGHFLEEDSNSLFP